MNKQYVNMKRYLITTLSILTAGVILWAMWANTAPIDNEQYVKDMCTTYHNSIAERDTAYAKISSVNAILAEWPKNLMTVEKVELFLEISF